MPGSHMSNGEWYVCAAGPTCYPVQGRVREGGGDADQVGPPVGARLLCGSWVGGASGPAGKNNPRGRNAKLNAIFKSDFQIKGWVGSGDFA